MLLDEEHPDTSLLGCFANRLQQAGDDERGQAERELVGEEENGLTGERACEREDLLLAAREEAAPASEERLELGEQAEGDLVVAPADLDAKAGTLDLDTRDLAIDANVEGDALRVVVRDFAGGLVRGPIRGGNRGLGMGLVNMMRGGSPNRSQSLMRMRVLLQFVAIVVIMATLWVMGR